MPVDERIRQPFGVLHGGASVALAETVASIGAYELINIKEIKNQCAIKFFETLKSHGVPVNFTRQLKNDNLYSIINDVLK